MNNNNEHLEEEKIAMGQFSSDDSRQSIEIPKNWQERINNPAGERVKKRSTKMIGRTNTEGSFARKMMPSLKTSSENLMAQKFGGSSELA